MELVVTYRELHAYLVEGTQAPYSLGYGTLKTEIGAAIGNSNPLVVAHTVRSLNQLGAVEPTPDGQWRVNAL